MKNREIVITWAILILVSTAVWGYAIKGAFHKCPEPEEPLVIELVMQVQERCGCKQIDGVIGPETMRLVNAQTKLEEPEYFNRCAAPYFTVSGAPSGEN